MTHDHADVRAARDGDAAARERLLEDLWPRAFRLAVAILGDRTEAEDAAQDALVAVATRLRDLHDPAAFPLWSTRIVVNAARTALRRRRRRSEPAGVTAPPFDELSSQRLDVLAALAALPDWLRVPVVLRYVEELNSREIGAALGAPPATIRFRLALARRRLAAALRDPAAQGRKEFA